MRVPNPSPVLDKNRAPMGPEMLSCTGAGLWRKAPKRFPDSSSALETFEFAKQFLISGKTVICYLNSVLTKGGGFYEFLRWAVFILREGFFFDR